MKAESVPSLRLRWIVALAFLLPFPLAWFTYYILDDESKTVCLFRMVTGRPCIFCGLVHAFSFAAHAQWSKANAHHPFWPVPAFICFGVGMIAIFSPTGLARLQQFIYKRWLWLVMAIAFLSVIRAWLLPLI